MKRTIIALTVMTSFAAVAAPNPSPSAYDRIQDGRISSVETDLNNTKLGVVVVDQKADAALSQSSAALYLAGEAKTDAQQALNGLAGKVDKADYAADKDAQNTRDNQQDALIETNGNKADAALQGVASNGSAITALQNGKVDKADFMADQQRQDDALVNEASIRAAGDNALGAKIVTKADQVALDKEVADRAAADRAQDVVTAQNYHDTTQKLATKVDNSTFQQRAADLDVRIAENRAAQQKTNQVVAGHTAQLANHEQRITSLEQQTNANFKDLRSQIDDNKREANAGIAGVAAIASIPQVTDKQDFSIGAGVGARDGESALAVGFSGRITPNVITKVAVSTDSQSGWTVGAGMSYGW